MTQREGSKNQKEELCPKPPSPFVREATGLVREFTWRDGTIMGCAYFNFALSNFLLYGLGAFFFPGSNMIITMGILAILINLPVLVVYSMFAGAMPRSGGEYIYVSRSLSPAIGFATSLVFFIYLIISSIGFQAYFALSLILSPMLAGLGSIYGNQGLIGLSTYILQPLPATVVGLILIATAFLVGLLPTSSLRKIMLALFAFSFLGYPVIYTLVLLPATNSQFISAFNTYAVTANLNTTYTGIIQTASTAGASIVPPTFLASVAAVPMVYVTLAFPNPPAYLCGETKHASKQVPLGMLATILGVSIITAILGFVNYNVFGYNFISATAYLGFSGSSAYPLPAAPYPDYFLAILYPNLPFNIFMMATGITWCLVLMITFIILASRALFAWSFDRLGPSALADINDRFHSPIKASVVAVVGGIIFLVLCVFSFLGVYFGSLVAYTSAFAVTTLAGIFFPFTKRSMFEQSPAIVKRKIGPLPVISLFGVLSLLTLGFMLYYLLANPTVSGISAPGLALIVFTYSFGIALFYGIRAYRKSRGVDLSLSYKELPPE
jgi:APA family basic amino acid/polyamine antiporter